VGDMASQLLASADCLVPHALAYSMPPGCLADLREWMGGGARARGQIRFGQARARRCRAAWPASTLQLLQCARRGTAASTEALVSWARC
jgi:hypothetical protein